MRAGIHYRRLGMLIILVHASNLSSTPGERMFNTRWASGCPRVFTSAANARRGCNAREIRPRIIPGLR